MRPVDQRISGLSAERRALLRQVIGETTEAPRASVERRSDPEAPLPLGRAQQAMWLVSQLADAAVYNLPAAVRLRGPLDRQALRAALDGVAARHEALRTVFPTRDGAPVQVVRAPASVPLAESRVGSEEELKRLALREARRPFSLAESPAWRVVLFRLGPEDHVLLGVWHHLIWDGWSIGVFTRELAALYDAALTGQPHSLPEVPVHYGDYVLWESADLERQGAWWVQALQGHRAVELPGKPRPLSQSFRGAMHFLELPHTAALDAFCQAEGVTPYMALLALQTALLSRWCGQEKLVIGTPAANRMRQELEGVIGYFANILALPVSVEGSFRELVAAVKATTSEAFARQDLPFEALVERIGAPRDASRNPLFQTMFALHAESLDALRLTDLSMETFALQADTTHFDLGLHLWRKGDVLSGYWSYATDLFPASSIARLSEQLNTLLGEALKAPDRPVHELSCLPESERAWLDRPAEDFTLPAGTVLDSGGYPSKGTEGAYLYAPPEVGEAVALAGHPLKSVRIVDARGRLTPLGVPGRILVEGVPTADRGRWTEQGLLEVLGAWDRSLWTEGRRVPLATLEHRLRSDVCVHDAWIEADPWVVYVVPRARVVPGRLLALLPMEARLTLVDHLPLDAEGRVDVPALRALEVVDEALAASWTQALSDQGVRARVLLKDRERARGLLHLGRVVKDWRRQAVESATSVDRGQVVSFSEGPQAYADGGPLELAPDAARTLTEALLRHQDSPRGLVVYEDDGSKVELSYGQLITRGRRVLAGLRAAGLGPGDRVVLQLGSLADHFAVFWGCVFAGVVPVCVANAPAWDRKGTVLNKLTNVWKLLGRPPVVTNASLEPSLKRAAAVYQESFTLLVAEDLLACEPAQDLHPARPDEVVFYQLTSGSTGVPKCIQETHDGILHHVHGSAAFCDYRADDVSVNWLPMDHVVPILTFHLKDSVLGIQQVHARTGLVIAEPLRWLDLLHEHRATHTWAPNFAFKLVNDSLQPGRTWDLSRMKFFMNAGEQVTLPVIREFVTRLAPFGVTQQSMQPAFGMAEVCTCMTYANDFTPETGAFHFTKDSLSGRLQDGHEVSFVDLGPPMPGVEIRIAGANNETLTERVIGRFQIRGRVVTPGYLDNPSANAESFVGEGWFDSGDLGFIADGRLALTGRAKEMIIVRGANLYCYEIEEVVCGLDGVLPTFAAAFSVDDPATGTESLAVFFVPQTGCSTELLQQVHEVVTREFGVSPAVVLPLEQREFQKTTSGKIQRMAMKKALAAGDFDRRLVDIDLALGKAGSTVPDWFHEPVWREAALREGPAAEVVQVHSLEGVLQRLQRAEAGESLLFVARGSLPVLDEDPGQWTLLRGLLKSAEQELGIRCKLLDTDDESVIQAERGDPEPEVAWRQGRRLVPRLSRVRFTAPGAELLGRDGMVLVTGGLGGIGQQVARLLLEQGHAVLLTGRSELEGPELGTEGLGQGLSVAEKRDALARLHGPVLYRAVDVLDPAALSRAVSEAEAELGRTLSAAVHLAGVFPARLLSEETPDSLALTLAPKVEGSRVLSELLGERPLLLMSSVYAHFGGAASGAYSAACSGLEGVAHERRGQGWPTVVMAASNFDEVGMSRGYAWRDRSLALGWSMIEVGRGLRSLRAVAASGRPVVVVGLDENKANVARWLDGPASGSRQLLALHLGGAHPMLVRDARGRASRCELRRVESLDGEHVAAGGIRLARTALERTIASSWREVLGLEQVDIDKSFFALGGQSIQLVQVLARLQARLGRDIPVVELFKHPTVRELALFLEKGDDGGGKERLALAADRARRQREALKKRRNPRRTRR